MVNLNKSFIISRICSSQPINENDVSYSLTIAAS